MHREKVTSIRHTIGDCMQLTVHLTGSADRELAAFAGAVDELFGPEQARQSVEDWMEKLESMEWPDGGATPDWRRLTIAAAASLACRVRALRPDEPPSMSTSIHFD